MIIGTGVDIVKIERFIDKEKQTRFMERVFSMREREYLAAKGVRGPQSMAGLFAAKEAVAKALGTGFAGFFPCDIEILHTPQGKPYVELHGKAHEILKKATPAASRRLKRRRCFAIHVSISHSEADAIAFAVLEVF